MDLYIVEPLVAEETGLAVVATTGADGTVQASVGQRRRATPSGGRWAGGGLPHSWGLAQAASPAAPPGLRRDLSARLAVGDRGG